MVDSDVRHCMDYPDSQMAVTIVDPVGIHEIAQRLRVEVETVYMWRSRKRLPDPATTISGSPCWSWETIEEWASKRPSLVKRKSVA